MNDRERQELTKQRTIYEGKVNAHVHKWRMFDPVMDGRHVTDSCDCGAVRGLPLSVPMQATRRGDPIEELLYEAEKFAEANGNADLRERLRAYRERITS